MDFQFNLYNLALTTSTPTTGPLAAVAGTTSVLGFFLTYYNSDTATQASIT
jgi:hypothetical protein